MHPKELKEAFKRGENISQLLRELNESDVNTEEIITTMYDFQAGSYVDALKDKDCLDWKISHGRAIAKEIRALMPDGGSVLEPGVGEGTTMSFVTQADGELGSQFDHIHGFDISWSRVARCRSWLQSQSLGQVFLSVASIFNAPYANNSFDIVYTSHSIEPNGGAEAAILKELYRISSRYLILIEPAYELGSAEARQRMVRLGYVRGLQEHAERMGMKVLKNELLSVQGNPLNPTGVIVIEKQPDAASAVPQLACPRYGDALADFGEAWFSAGSLRAYPIIGGLPCFRKSDGVIASQFEALNSPVANS